MTERNPLSLYSAFALNSPPLHFLRRIKHLLRPRPLFLSSSIMAAEMDMCGQDFIRVDDLLDFSNNDIFDPEAASSPPFLAPPPVSSTANRQDGGERENMYNPLCSSFSDDLCVPSEDVAELEWLSKFVEDSFSDFPLAAAIDGGGNCNFWADSSVPGRARSKRSRAAAPTWTSPPSTSEAVAPPEEVRMKAGARKKEAAPPPPEGVRKCTHCATEKTPQWRTGPMGPKSLCNACGVRYKSGRLVPEYRPAASPTFVLTQHSNSHRKVMELRRQKELLRQEKFVHDFKVC